MDQSICFHDVKSVTVTAIREFTLPETMEKRFSRELKITNEEGHQTVITLFSNESSSLEYYGTNGNLKLA